MHKIKRRTSILGALALVIGSLGFAASASADQSPADAPSADQPSAKKGGGDKKLAGYLLVTGLNNLCLDVSNGNTGNGAKLITWECYGGPAQRFFFDGGKIRNENSGKCLDIVAANPGRGAGVQMFDCHNDWPAQKWHWDGGRLVSDMNGACLDIAAGNRYPGATIMMWECNGSTAQEWRIV